MSEFFPDKLAEEQGLYAAATEVVRQALIESGRNDALLALHILTSKRISTVAELPITEHLPERQVSIAPPQLLRVAGQGRPKTPRNDSATLRRKIIDALRGGPLSLSNITLRVLRQAGKGNLDLIRGQLGDLCHAGEIKFISDGAKRQYQLTSLNATPEMVKSVAQEFPEPEAYPIEVNRLQYCSRCADAWRDGHVCEKSRLVDNEVIVRAVQALMEKGTDPEKMAKTLGRPIETIRVIIRGLRAVA